jgi:hypothetical protein
MIEEVVAVSDLDLPLNASFGLAVAQLRSVSVKKRGMVHVRFTMKTMYFSTCDDMAPLNI